jgi:hypothetical protein
MRRADLRQKRTIPLPWWWGRDFTEEPIFGQSDPWLCVKRLGKACNLGKFGSKCRKEMQSNNRRPMGFSLRDRTPGGDTH